MNEWAKEIGPIFDLFLPAELPNEMNNEGGLLTPLSDCLINELQGQFTCFIGDGLGNIIYPNGNTWSCLSADREGKVNFSLHISN